MPRTTGYVAAQARHASSVDVPVRPTAPQLIHLSSIGDNAVVLQHAWQPRRDETALDADVSVTYCTRRSVVRNVTRRSRGGPPPAGGRFELSIRVISPAPPSSRIIDALMRRPETARSITSDTLESFLLKVLLYGVGFGGSILVSRGLGPTGRGIYYLPVVTAATVSAMATLGIEQANVFLFGSHAVSIGRLWGQGGFIALSLGTLGGLLLVDLPFLLPATFASSPPPLWWIVAAGLPFVLHTQFAAGLLTLRGDVTWQFRAALISGVLQTAALVGLFVSGSFFPAGVLAVSVASSLVTWVLTISKLAGADRWIRWDAQLLKLTLTRSLVLHAGMLLLFLHLRADMFMLNRMAGPASLGVYSLSVTLAETVLLATDSVAIAVLPRQMGNSIQEAAVTALRAARVNLLLSASLTVAWGIIGFPLIVTAFGQPFRGSYLPLMLLLPGIASMGMQRVCGGPVLRRDQNSRIIGINAVSLSLNIGLNLLWIPRWGAAGAALASACSYFLGALLFLYWTTRMARCGFLEGVVPARADLQLAARALRLFASLRREGRVPPKRSAP